MGKAEGRRPALGGSRRGGEGGGKCGEGAGLTGQEENTDDG